MKAYITKYCLTSGIEEIDAVECGEGMISYKSGAYTTYCHGEGKDWHRTYGSAFDRAEDMRQKKIISLQKQIVKLSKLNFA